MNHGHEHGPDRDHRQLSDRELLIILVAQNFQVLEHQHLIMERLDGVEQRMTELDDAVAGLKAEVDEVVTTIGGTVEGLQAQLAAATAAAAAFQAADVTDAAARDQALADLAAAHSNIADNITTLQGLTTTLSSVIPAPAPAPEPQPDQAPPADTVVTEAPGSADGTGVTGEAPNPEPTPEPGTTTEPAPEDGGTGAVATEPASPAVEDPAPAPAAVTLYKHIGDDGFDTGQWVDAGVTDVDGNELYRFTGDVNPGDATGVSDAWQVSTPA